MKKLLSYKNIKNLNPCYDPIKYIDKNWNGSLTDLLKMKQIPAKDRLWVCVRHKFMSDMQLKQYGLAVAKLCEKNSTDKRVKTCNETTARFLQGKATLSELSAARSAAEFAARFAAKSARSAAWSAAESAAWSAAESAAEYAAWSAAWSAAESARFAAWSAARSAAEEKQCKILIKILKTY